MVRSKTMYVMYIYVCLCICMYITYIRVHALACFCAHTCTYLRMCSLISLIIYVTQHEKTGLMYTKYTSSYNGTHLLYYLTY